MGKKFSADMFASKKDGGKTPPLMPPKKGAKALPAFMTKKPKPFAKGGKTKC